MAKHKLIYRPSRGRDGQYGSIYIRVTYKRKSRTVTVAKDIRPSEWDDYTQQLIFPTDNPARANALRKIEKNILEKCALLIKMEEAISEYGYYTVDDIMDKFLMKTENSTLYMYSQRLASELEKSGKIRTAEAYKTCTKGLLKFAGTKNFKLTDINIITMKAFEEDLRNRGKSPNTISYYMRNIRAIYNKAVYSGLIKNQKPRPFSTVFTGFYKTTKRALSSSELQKFFSLDLKGKLATLTPGTPMYSKYKELYKAWRLFFFCFYTRGLCYIDLAFLKKENIRNGVLIYYRKKTGQLMEVKVTNDMREIIDSFSSETYGSEYLFPIINDPTKSLRQQYSSAMRMQNRRLGELAQMAGLSRGVTTHVARHTYATLMKQKNFPLIVISESLGHTTEKTTSTYLASLDRSVLDEANEVVTSPFQQSLEKSVESNQDFNKGIQELINKYINDDSKAEVIFPFLKGLFKIFDASTKE